MVEEGPARLSSIDHPASSIKPDQISGLVIQAGTPGRQRTSRRAPTSKELKK